MAASIAASSLLIFREDAGRFSFRSGLSFGFDGAITPLAEDRNRSFDGPVVVALILREHADFHKSVERLIGVRDHNAQTASAIPLTLAMTTLTVANNHPVVREALHVLIRDVRNIR
ncbi:hypothetical protein JJC00_01665 [Bradyrhizobium diazoefficiens]|uniref:hypothetical protein n=1 Tax=Bradyrhizobium diazoefficiens TaxID=1355477 RepID=UPI00190AF034|nr:hypothetical protein [Bradyrhizobium diazoefficiens]QQO34449.1 hypothetical protein JJC00_01665 [Bradyrhizobium diazoefficiens]